MSRNVFGRVTAIAAVALALSLTGCGKKEEAKAAPAKAEAKKGEAKKGEEKKAAEAKPAEKKAAEGEKKAEAGGDNVAKAKALVDKMAGKMEEMLKEVEGAGGDQAKIKAIGEKFKKFAESNKSEGEALNKALKPEEKKTVDEYARKKMAPLMGKFMAVMMKNRPAPGGAAPAAAAAPGAAAPAAAAPGAA
ncbi:MAG: hypothetical protein KC502_06430, partial [Myxococcales bacterium]|nr:hypothetical protein [Myxococcales bacterium]